MKRQNQKTKSRTNKIYNKIIIKQIEKVRREVARQSQEMFSEASSTKLTFSEQKFLSHTLCQFLNSKPFLYYCTRELQIIDHCRNHNITNLSLQYHATNFRYGNGPPTGILLSPCLTCLIKFISNLPDLN